MKLSFPHFDGRRRTYTAIPVVDKETGKEVGQINVNGVGFEGWEIHAAGGIEVSLFGGQYQITANRYEECWGFVKGVEAVLNRTTSTREVIFKATIPHVA